MGKYSQKMMGKEVGPASVYAEPHTMTGKKIDSKAAQAAVSGAVDPNTLSAKDMRCGTPAPRVSTGDPGRNDVKTSGIQVRGGKAQTKGKMARGPMA
jgi:hypothetical protein